MGEFKAPEPDACGTLAEVRSGIEEVDAAIVDLLTRRKAYAVKAARMTSGDDAGGRESEASRVIGDAVARAARKGLLPDLVRAIWLTMIDRFDDEALQAERAAWALASTLKGGDWREP